MSGQQARPSNVLLQYNPVKLMYKYQFNLRGIDELQGRTTLQNVRNCNFSPIEQVVTKLSPLSKFRIKFTKYIYSPQLYGLKSLNKLCISRSVYTICQNILQFKTQQRVVKRTFSNFQKRMVSSLGIGISK